MAHRPDINNYEAPPMTCARSQSTPSEVYQRYYGFMLGFVTSLLRMDWAKPRYAAHRYRMEEVMFELDIGWKLPKRHSEYRRDDRIQLALARELTIVGKIISDFYAFGVSVLHVFVDPQSQPGRTASRTFREVALEYDLDLELLAGRVRRNWDRGLQDEDLIAELLGRAFELAAVCLLSVAKDPRTCFVIMPFAQPFRDYYRTFYRRSLNLAGYESIRAWEGVTNERYLSMVLMLLQKCGAALADLSAPEGSNVPNLNVIHEVGINMGSTNLTYLIRQRPEGALPSNFIGLPYLTYDPSAGNWPEGQAKELAKALREIDKARRGHQRISKKRQRGIVR